MKMDNSIVQCIQIRKDFFEKYYSVPNNIQPEVDDFFSKMQVLGEQCADAQEFEAKFAENGLQDCLNTILMQCTPKPYNMTKEEKAASKEIFKEDRSDYIKKAAKDAIDYANVMANEEVISKTREKMIEADIFDDYTRASNAIEITKDVGGFIKGLFKKKK